MDISDLPLEVLVYIFDFLDHPDLKDARLVCKKWYRASLASNHTRKEYLYLHSNNADIPSLLKSDRSFYNLRIQWKKTIWAVSEFWEKFGPGVHSLIASRCKLEERHFFNALSFCPRLRDLELRRVFRLRRFTPVILPDFQLTELSSLVLDNWDFDYALCDAIVTRSPNLKALTVKADLEAHNQDYQEEPPSVDLVRYMKDNPQLTFNVKLIYHSTDNDVTAMFKTVVRLPHVRIQEFDSPEIDTNLSKLRGHREIKALGTEGFILDDNTLHGIYETFPNLESLTAYCSGNTMYDSLSSLYLLQNLTTLEIYLPPTVSDAVILPGLCSQENRKLKSLKLRVKCDLSENCFVELMRCNPALREIQLDLAPRFNKTITDWSIQALFKYQEGLEKLKLVNSIVTDAGLSGKIMEDYQSQPRNPTGHSISRLKKMRELSLIYCDEISGSSFASDFKFPSIKLLRIDTLRKLPLVDDVYKSLIENNRTIEILFLSSEKKVKCNGFGSLIIKNLWRLKKLHLWGFKNVTKRELNGIQRHFGPRLKIFGSTDSPLEDWDDDDEVSVGSEASCGPLPSPYRNRDPSPVSGDSSSPPYYGDEDYYDSDAYLYDL